MKKETIFLEIVGSWTILVFMIIILGMVLGIGFKITNKECYAKIEIDGILLRESKTGEDVEFKVKCK